MTPGWREPWRGPLQVPGLAHALARPKAPGEPGTVPVCSTALPAAQSCPQRESPFSVPSRTLCLLDQQQEVPGLWWPCPNPHGWLHTGVLGTITVRHG